MASRAVAVGQNGLKSEILQREPSVKAPVHELEASWPSLSQTTAREEGERQVALGATAFNATSALAACLRAPSSLATELLPFF